MKYLLLVMLFLSIISSTSAKEPNKVTEGIHLNNISVDLDAYRNFFSDLKGPSTDFCQTFKKILEKADKDFNSLKGESKTFKDFFGKESTEWKAKLQLDGTEGIINEGGTMIKGHYITYVLKDKVDKSSADQLFEQYRTSLQSCLDTGIWSSHETNKNGTLTYSFYKKDDPGVISRQYLNGILRLDPSKDHAKIKLIIYQPEA